MRGAAPYRVNGNKHACTAAFAQSEVAALRTGMLRGKYKCWRTKTKPAIFAVQGRCTKTKPTTGRRFSSFRSNFQRAKPHGRPVTAMYAVECNGVKSPLTSHVTTSIEYRPCRKFKVREVFEGARCAVHKCPRRVSRLQLAFA